MAQLTSHSGGLVDLGSGRLANAAVLVDSAGNPLLTTAEGTLLASAARTATVDTADQTNVAHVGVQLHIDVTAVTATPSVVFTLTAKDPVSGVYAVLLTSAAIVGTGHTLLTLYPGVTVAANVAVSQALPRIWRVTATHADADSITYSVGYSLLL